MFLNNVLLNLDAWSLRLTRYLTNRYRAVHGTHDVIVYLLKIGFLEVSFWTSRTAIKRLVTTTSSLL